MDSSGPDEENRFHVRSPGYRGSAAADVCVRCSDPHTHTSTHTRAHPRTHAHIHAHRRTFTHTHVEAG